MATYIYVVHDNIPKVALNNNLNQDHSLCVMIHEYQYKLYRKCFKEWRLFLDENTLVKI